MGVPEILKNAETSIKAILESKELSSAVAETIRENKGKIVGGALGLGALYILKDKKIKFKMKDGDKEIEFESE
ncbi:hypothetical protein [Viridibacillus sp. FSL H8-0110]|uniref:hypothetical protein n=1 Tax=Viridibacillus sp. FSL H8-0110 TaxID=2921376 RepID=UPI0030F66CFA